MMKRRTKLRKSLLYSQPTLNELLAIEEDILASHIICEASLQNPQNVALNEIVVILYSNLISLIKLQ